MSGIVLSDSLELPSGLHRRAADGNGTQDVHDAPAPYAITLHPGAEMRTGKGLSAGAARPILGSRERNPERDRENAEVPIMSDFAAEDDVETIGPDGVFDDVGEDAEPYDEDDLDAWDEETEAFDSERDGE
ncbi:hypothetical protein [Microterricola gilva]|nr:hypothetical protein [Microterricola gilva]